MDRVVGAVLLGEYDEVAEFVASVSNLNEGRGLVEAGAEEFPLSEHGGVGFACFAGSGFSGSLQSSAEINFELSSAGM